MKKKIYSSVSLLMNESTNSSQARTYFCFNDLNESSHFGHGRKANVKKQNTKKKELNSRFARETTELFRTFIKQQNNDVKW